MKGGRTQIRGRSVGQGKSVSERRHRHSVKGNAEDSNKRERELKHRWRK
jgi:hypothetical protein